jgi:hypothetical protein
VDAQDAVVFPQDLNALSVEELTALNAQALARFNALADQEDIDDAGVEELETTAAGIENVTAALSAKTVAASNNRRVTAASEKVAQLRGKMDDDKKNKKMPYTMGADTAQERNSKQIETPSAEAVTVEAEDETEDESQPVTAGGARTRPRGTLAAAQAHAPGIITPNNDLLVVTASAPTAGVQSGTSFDSFNGLADAFISHAKSQVVTEGRPGFQPVASIKNEFAEVIEGDRTSLGEFSSMVDRLRADSEALVAGGGWCAPSEIRYDFFNIACQDGMIDLPTFGVNRGGIMHAVSPSLADVFTGEFTNATNPWLWTEADDILTVTGAPNKPCVRVTCPSFTDRRLECYGICLTAGNLTDSAYPEATRNHLSLLMAAHYHAMNQRYIQTMVGLSTAAITMPTGCANSIASDLPDAVALAANDIRSRFGMCEDDILEVVIPRWAKDAIRSDLSRRTGDAAYLTMSEADINRLFTTRRVRVQWVNDWQIRGAGLPGGATALTSWPALLDFMIYPAGTFVRGNGLTLDLGVVRDSVLNAENDHTAAWTEECHLIAMYGHESRLYRMNVCVGGKTGGTFDACCVA